MQENWFIRDNCIDVTLEMRPITRNFINAWILFGRSNVWITYRRAFLTRRFAILKMDRCRNSALKKNYNSQKTNDQVYRMAVLNKSNRRVNHRVIINIYERRRKRVAYILLDQSIFRSWPFFIFKIFFFLSSFSFILIFAFNRLIA